MSTYNGWINFETWLMNLNLTNEEGCSEFAHDAIKMIPDAYQAGEALKEAVEEVFFVEEYSIYKICDTWTLRDFQEIVWMEIAKSLMEEQTTNTKHRRLTDKVTQGKLSLDGDQPVFFKEAGKLDNWINHRRITDYFGGSTK